MSNAEDSHHTRSLLRSGWRKALLLAAAGGLAACEPEMANQAGEAESLTDALLGALAAYVPPLLAYVVLRRVAVRLVLRRMMERAPQGMAPAPRSSEDPLETEAPRDAAASTLGLVELDAEREVELDGIFEERRRRALRSGSRSWWGFALALLVFVVAAVSLGHAYRPDPMAAGMAGTGVGAFQGMLTQMLGAAWPGVMVGAVLFVALWVGGNTLVLGRVPMPSATIGLLVLTGLGALATPALGAPLPLAVMPGLLAAATFAWRQARLVRGAREDKNNRLLILRVFGSDSNTASVFGELTRRWGFVGSYATIADPSFVRYHFSLSYPRSGRKMLRFVSLYGLVLGVASMILNGAAALPFQLLPLSIRAPLEAMSLRQTQELLGIVAWFVLVPLALLPVAWYVRRRFFDSSDALRSGFGKLRVEKADWRGIHDGRPFYCFDDVWRPAVQRLLESVDVVLMDLRGYTQERRGCEYELGLLVDRFPLSRVVLLVEEDSTRTLVVETLTTKLAEAAESSPNRGTGTSPVTIYRTGERDPRDIERLVALLAAGAADNEGRLGHREITETGRPWLRGIRRFLYWLGSRRAAWSEAIDMAVARPPLSRIATPLLVLALVTLFYVRAKPVWEIFRSHGRSHMLDLSRSEPPRRVGPTDPGSRVLETLDTYGYSDWRDTRVRADLAGVTLAGSSHFGDIEITRAVDGQGTSLSVLAVEPPMAFTENLLTGMYRINRGKMISFGVDGSSEREDIQPEGGVSLWFTLERTEGLTHVAAIEGTIALKKPDPDAVVRLPIDHLPEAGTTELSHPDLLPFGEFSLAVQSFDFGGGLQTNIAVQLISTGNHDFTLMAYDKSGTRRTSRGKGSSSMGGLTTHYWQFEPEQFVGGGFDVITDWVTERWEFRVTDVELEQR